MNPGTASSKSCSRMPRSGPLRKHGLSSVFSFPQYPNFYGVFETSRGPAGRWKQPWLSYEKTFESWLLHSLDSMTLTKSRVQQSSMKGGLYRHKKEVEAASNKIKHQREAKHLQDPVDTTCWAPVLGHMCHPRES